MVAAMGTEYTCAYNFKTDSIKGSKKAVTTAVEVLAKSGKTEQQIGRTLLAKGLNQYNTAYTQGIVQANRLLRGQGDSRLSHLTAIHDTVMYALPLPSSLESATSAAPIVYHVAYTRTDRSTMHTFSDLDSYRARSSALDLFSPIEMTMAFEPAKPATTIAARYYLLQHPHPMAETYGHNPYARMRLPQTLSHHVFRPETTASPELCEKYAAWALGNFFSDRKMHLLKGATLWAQLLYWEQHKPRGDLDRVAWQLLRNAQVMARARALCVENAQIVRERVRVQRPPPGQRRRSGSDDGSDSDWSDLADEDFYGASDVEAMRGRIEQAMSGDLSAAASNRGVVEAMACLPITAAERFIHRAMRPSAVCHEPDNLDLVVSNQAALLQSLDTATEPKLSRSARDWARLRLVLQKINGKMMKPSVVIAPPCVASPGDEAAMEDLRSVLAERRTPPYVRCSEPPDEADCVLLFNLCPEQAFPFRLLARTLLLELQNKSPPQLTLLIMGLAGTGKSEIINAFLWFAFQHSSSHLIAVSAYTWKAANLISTEHNPASSCASMYGISCYGGDKDHPGGGRRYHPGGRRYERARRYEPGGTTRRPAVRARQHRKAAATFHYCNTSPQYLIPCG